MNTELFISHLELLTKDVRRQSGSTDYIEAFMPSSRWCSTANHSNAFSINILSTWYFVVVENKFDHSHKWGNKRNEVLFILVLMEALYLTTTHITPGPRSTAIGGVYPTSNTSRACIMCLQYFRHLALRPCFHLHHLRSAILPVHSNIFVTCIYRYHSQFGRVFGELLLHFGAVIHVAVYRV